MSLRRFSIILAAVAWTARLSGEPPNYVSATAYHLLPETTSEESGYFSLSESLDGAIHVGTAKYNANAFLIEFDPGTGKQRVVLDTHKTCGLTATGYAAQSKIHTRNFVGPSGKVYVGSKQGYAVEGDSQAYPGGYVMTYDPRTGRTENLGMPWPTQGVIDVAADEQRKRLYVVTCEEQHWIAGTLAGAPWRELGPLLTPYATTLVDERGVASALTKDFGLAQFNPATGRVTTRPILVNGAPWTRASSSAVPTWLLDRDGRHAWVVLMNDPTLLRIDLQGDGNASAESCGTLLEGTNPDSRGALTLHPDGKVYALIRVDNTAGFGSGYLHHLVRYDPATQRREDLGVLKVENPNYFAWGVDADGKPKPHTHGFHKLPDGTLTPLHAHMALLATRDGTLYATILYPFTLLKIEGYRMPPQVRTTAANYLEVLEKKLDESWAQLPEITRIAEQVAERYLHGGFIGFPWIGSTLEQELTGRSGGIMHLGFERASEGQRPVEARGQDVVIFAWDDGPNEGDLAKLRDCEGAGRFVLGFGAAKSSQLTSHVAACDAWIDSGGREDDRALELSDGTRVGKTNHFTNALHGWLFTGEFIAALTRRGSMPVMWRNVMMPEAKAWNDRYLAKQPLHDDLVVPSIPPGELSHRYIERIRSMLRRVQRTELRQITTMAHRIATELRAGRKTLVASMGHMGMNFVGRFDDAVWATNHEVSDGLDSQMATYATTPNDALVLRLGYMGLHRDLHALFERKRQRVMLITAENPNQNFAVPSSYDIRVDSGFAFGDACVSIEGYPIPILPPSGLMQIAIYESINVEVHGENAPKPLAPDPAK